MTELISIDVVLLFQKAERGSDLGPVIDAALKELEAFWNMGHSRIALRRYILSGPTVDGLTTEWRVVRFLEAAWKAVADDRWQPKPEWSPQSLNAADLFESSRGRYRDTLNPDALLAFVRKALRLSEPVAPLVLVVDGKIQPPEELSYVAARSYGVNNDQTVISSLTIDPEFWSIKDIHRRRIIKQRIRSLCISFVGELLNLRHCSEPSCYMYEFTDYLQTLDSMLQLGSDHAIPELAGKGFEFPGPHPESVQDIVDPVKKWGGDA